jgi:hypothetical protein
MIDRRVVITALASITAAGIVPARPIRGAILRERLAPIMPDISSGAYWLMRPILKTATWQYQKIGGAARQGIIRHLASGYTFLTYTAPVKPWHRGDYWIAVQPLFRDGEALPADLAEHHAIGLAATHAGTIATDVDDGCIYLPPDADTPITKAPPIIAEDFQL